MMTHRKNSKTPFDFIIDIIYAAITNPKSNYYLPQVIKRQKSPGFEPYEVDEFGLALDRSDPLVCDFVDPPPVEATKPIGLPNVLLKDSGFFGFSNVSPKSKPEIIAQDTSSASLSVDLIFSDLKISYPPVITVKGRFNYSQRCCETKEDECVKEYTADGAGTYELEVRKSEGKVRADLSTDGETVVTNLKSLTYDAPVKDPLSGKRNVEVTKVKVEDGAPYVEQAFKESLNYYKTLEQVFANLNTELNHPDTLEVISNKITKAINEILNT